MPGIQIRDLVVDEIPTAKVLGNAVPQHGPAFSALLCRFSISGFSSTDVSEDTAHLIS